MRNKGRKKDCDNFLKEEFKFPQKQSLETVDADLDPVYLYQKSLEEHVKEIELLIMYMNKSDDEIELLSQAVREQSLVSINKSKEISSLRQKLDEITAVHEKKSNELQKAMTKLSKITPRNFNKKIKRRDEVNMKLLEKSKQQEEKIKEKEKKS